MAMTVTLPNWSQVDIAGLWSPASLKPVKLTGDTSYPGGTGYAVTPGTFGFTQAILAVIPAVVPSAQAVQSNYAWYDAQNKSVRFLAGYQGGTVSESVASGTSATSIVLDVFVVGY